MFKVEAKTKAGKKYFSWHKTKQEAEYSKKQCYGKYPFGNRVKIIKEI